MRKFLPFLFAAALASSCIDNAYDLSNVNTDDVTIGDEDSEYRLPLATVYVSMSELNEGGADIKTLFDEADIWLPSPLPGNAAYVDLRELQNTPETITPLLDALNQAGDWLLRRQRAKPSERQRLLILTDGRLRDLPTLAPLPCPTLLLDTERAPIRLGRARQLAAELGAQYHHIDTLALSVRPVPSTWN